MITGILIAAALVGGTGLVIGLLLGVAGKKFAVEENSFRAITAVAVDIRDATDWQLQSQPEKHR